MNVKRIEWLSKDAEEAILFISDGEYECTVFSHPCNYNEGDCITGSLFAVSVKGIHREEQESKIFIENQNDIFSQFIIAKVIDRDPNLVKVGNITIELDESIPIDINSNEIVSFTCSRLDTI